MRKYKKILVSALALFGTGAFMLPNTLPVQAAVIQPRQIQSANAIQSLQKVTAVARVYGSGEHITEAILEYPQALLPSAVKSSDFMVDGQEIVAIAVNNKPEFTDKAKTGRYVILQFAKQSSVYDGDLSKKPGRQEMQADDNNGKGTDAPSHSNRKLPNLALQVQQVHSLEAINGTSFTPTSFSNMSILRRRQDQPFPTIYTYLNTTIPRKNTPCCFSYPMPVPISMP